MARNPQFFLANTRSQGEANRELLRVRFGGPRLAPIRGLASFWDAPTVMDSKELIYFTSEELIRLMDAQEFADAWLFHPGTTGAAPVADGALGATCAPGATGAPGGPGAESQFSC